MAARHRRAAARARNRIDQSHREEPTWKTCGDDTLLAETPKVWPHAASLHPDADLVEAAVIHHSSYAAAILSEWQPRFDVVTVREVPA